ncbi:uncharacterized protein LOC108912319 [Anoplophora glabripennis]|uniref:uncharacterized protein LOC108912319 n=1 Tax=Anoplophora glabripennis TaxID=217634 RepID=UPI000874CA23|nr:uncharacterized protein LOC108912319 [Anoplophora glabripennis]
MDNAFYHSRKCELTPQQSWRKARIQEWLRDKGAPYDETSLKTELLQLVKLHAHKYKKLAVDELALSHRITVLRLPPYHCELNPIELILAQVKGEVAGGNRSVKLADVQRHLKKALENVTTEDWRKCINHADKEEKKIWDVDNMVDEVIDPFIINVGNSDSDSDSDR